VKIEPPKYRSSQSVAQAKPIYIDVRDPRVSKQNYGRTVARAGAPVVVVDSTSKSLMAISANLVAATTQSATTSTGSNPTGDPSLYPVISCTLPLITNLTAAWVGKSVVLTFTFDTTIGASSNFFGYQVQVYDGSIWWPFANKIVASQSTGQPWTLASTDNINWTLTLPSTLIAQTGVFNPISITQIEIEPIDADFLTPSYTVATITGGYTSDLPAPIISVTAATDSYTVTTSNFATASAIADFNAETIEEYVTPITDSTQLPTAAGAPWVVVNQNATKSPIGISAPDDAHRWVRARFQSKDAGFSAYSNYVDVTPKSFIPSNTYPPVMVSNVNAQWAALGSPSSSGNDVLVTYTQPDPNTITATQTAPSQIKVKLVPVIGGVASTLYAAYFYHTLIGTADTSFVISKSDMFNTFGKYYASYTAYVSVLSAAGIESTTNYQVTTFSRSNPLAGITPVLGVPNINNPDGVFRVTAITNGYTVDWDLPAGATYAEVYDSTTAWTSYPADDSDVVYRGLSPAVVQTPDYNNHYIIMHYYDDYGNYSNYSTYLNGGALVTPVDIGKNSLINDPIKISTNGSIFSGAGGSSVYPQVFFNDQGLFAYDASGNWTTEIINNASTNAPTFVTKRAQIADWTIAPSAIESTLIPNVITTYTGMSASNPSYAFWAGSSQSQNSSGDAPFYVTPTGSVHATNLSIVGNGISGSYLITAGGASNFSITQDGILNARQANISGSLNVTQSSNFSSNVNVGINGIITAGASQQTGASVQINYTGLVAYDLNHNPTTKIYGNAVANGATFWTQNAQIGGWNVNATQIASTKITLDSSANTITILASDNSAYGVQLAVGTYQGTVVPGIAIGNLSNPSFKVTMGGILTANGATIGGAVNVTDHLQIGTKTAIGDYTHPGGYVDSAGSFIFGNSTAYIQYDQTSSSTNINLTTTVRNYGNTAYSGYSQIVLGSGGTIIKGMPIQGDNFSNGYPTTLYNDNNPSIGLGALSRQRMLVEDPYDGITRLGMAVYYQDSTGPHNSNPVGSTGGSDSGSVGDLWVVF